jgi:alpha-tubulin suppressor-like RCC1 family protein
LGNGTQVDSLTPVQIETSGVVDVSPYWDTTLYVKSDGSLWGMGRNYSKMLKTVGTPSNNYLSPVKIVESGVTKAAVGYWYLIYLKDDGSVWGRGDNYHRQLGQSGGSHYSDPVQIVSSGAVDVAAGAEFSMI